MTIFDLVAQFTEVTKMPFALHWTPYTMKFIGIFLLLYGGAILFYYTGQKNTRPGEEHGSASWAASGSWIRSTATRMQAKTSY